MSDFFLDGGPEVGKRGVIAAVEGAPFEELPPPFDRRSIKFRLGEYDGKNSRWMFNSSARACTTALR